MLILTLHEHHSQYTLPGRVVGFRMGASHMQAGAISAVLGDSLGGGYCLSRKEQSLLPFPNEKGDATQTVTE